MCLLITVKHCQYKIIATETNHKDNIVTVSLEDLKKMLLVKFILKSYT